MWVLGILFTLQLQCYHFYVSAVFTQTGSIQNLFITRYRSLQITVSGGFIVFIDQSRSQTQRYEENESPSK